MAFGEIKTQSIDTAGERRVDILSRIRGASVAGTRRCLHGDARRSARRYDRALLFCMETQGKYSFPAHLAHIVYRDVVAFRCTKTLH